jgi:hypothetical protein
VGEQIEYNVPVEGLSGCNAYLKVVREKEYRSDAIAAAVEGDSGVVGRAADGEVEFLRNEKEVSPTATTTGKKLKQR